MEKVRKYSLNNTLLFATQTELVAREKTYAALIVPNDSEDATKYNKSCSDGLQDKDAAQIPKLPKLIYLLKLVFIEMSLIAIQTRKIIILLRFPLR